MNGKERAEMLMRLELHINEQRADIAFIRLILKKFLVRTIATANPALAEERLQYLKIDTMATLDRQPPVRRGPDDRFHKLTKARTDEFFRELEELMAEARTMTGEIGRH